MLIKSPKKLIPNAEPQTSIKEHFIISVKIIENNKIRIHYKISDQECVIEHQFQSDKEQLTIKQLIPDCVAELYILPDASVIIDACDPEAALVVKTISTIMNNSSFDCGRLKLIGKNLNLQYKINVTNSCLLSFTEQLDNFGTLNIGTQFICEGAKSGRINNYGVISGKDRMSFDSIVRVMNYGLICSTKKLIINSNITCNYNTILSLDEVSAKAGKLFNLGVIFSQKELFMLCRKTLINMPNGIIGSNTDATLMRSDGLSPTRVAQTNTTFINQGSIEALNTVTLTNSKGVVINEQSGKIRANKMSVGGHEFSNSGYMSGDSKVQVVLSNTDSRWYNTSTGEVKTKYLECVFSQLLNDGKIYAQENLVSLLRTVHNQEHGKIISDGRLGLVALEKVINDCLIQAGKELSIHTSCLEVGVNGTLIANDISVIADKVDTSGKIIANTCCEIISKYFSSLETSETKSLEQLKLIVEQELSNQGLLHAKEKLLVNSQGQVHNGLSGVISSSQVILEAGELQNEGIIKAESELKIKILRYLENLASANISSLENLIIEVGGVVKNSGLISSEYQGLIKVSEVLQNDATGMIRAKELKLSAHQLDNFGTIEALRQLKITSDGVVTNYQTGKITSNQAVELLVNSLHNHGSVVSNNLKFFIANMLHNYETGVISANNTLDLIGAKLIFNAGEISSLQNIEITSTEVLENISTGKITAVKGLTAIAELLISNKGKLSAHDVYLNSAKLLLLHGLQDTQHLTAAAEIMDIYGKTTAKEINLEADVIEIDGTITTGSLNIEAKNYLHLLKNGEISCSDASKLLSSAGFINLGKILSQDKLQIIAQELFHGVDAVISAEHDLYLKAIDMYLDGNIQASQKLLVIVENDFVYKTFNLKANGELSLTLSNGSRINHDINTPGDLQLEFLTKEGILYNNARLQAGGDVIINEPGYLIVNGNYSQRALILAKKSLVIDSGQLVLQQGLLKAGHLDLTSKQQLTVAEKAKIEGVDGSIKVTEDSFKQYGELEFTGNLFINAKKQLVLAGASKIGGVLKAIADGNVSITESIEAQDIFIASLLDSVEIRSHKERIGNSENFTDVLKRARVCAKNILQIIAQKDVIFESAETESGIGGTHIMAIANILDIPIDLVRQRVQHFYDDECNGTIKDIWLEQVPSSHKTTGDFTSDAGVNGVHFAPRIQAENADICSGNDTKFMPITSSHSCEANLQGKESGMFGSKTTSFSSSSGSAATIGTNFAIRGQLTVDSKQELELHQPVSTALHNDFSAGGEVAIFHGKKSSYVYESSSSSDIMWSRSSETSSSSQQYIAPQFSGSISIKAKSARIEVVSGKILTFLDQIKEKPDDLTYITLYEQYQYHHESHEGPGPGLIALIALATAIATQGTASAWAASAIKASSISLSVGATATLHTAVTAGFQALMVKATTSMAANNFDVGKVIKDLASTSTLKDLAVQMASAGAMQHISGKLNLPTKVSKPSNIAVASKPLNAIQKINMGQRVINQVLKAGLDASLRSAVYHKDFDEALEDAVKIAAIATATGPITDKIDAAFASGSMNTAAHTLSHVLTSVAGSIASHNPNGVLVGALEGLISARLPGMLRDQDVKSTKSAQDATSEESEGKVTSIALEEQDKLVSSSTPRVRNKTEVTGPSKEQSVEDQILSRDQQSREEQRVMAKYGVINSQAAEQRQQSLAEKALDFFIPAAYAAELPYPPTYNPESIGSLGHFDYDGFYRDLFLRFHGSADAYDLLESESSLDRMKREHKNSYTKAVLENNYRQQEQSREKFSWVLTQYRALADKFDSSDWHPIRISSSVKKHTVGTGKDKSGRYHYRDLGTGKFSKSAMDKAKDSFRKGELPSAKIDSSVGTKLLDDQHCYTAYFLRTRTEGIETGGMAYVCSDNYARSSVNKDGINIERSIGGSVGLNLATGHAELPVGDVRLDVDAFSGTLKVGGHVNFSKEQNSFEVGLNAKISGPEVRGEFKSKKVCSNSSCVQVTVTPYTGVGVGVQGGIGYTSSAEKKDTANLSAGLGLGPMFGAQIKLEREPKQQNTENVSTNHSKPSP